MPEATESPSPWSATAPIFQVSGKTIEFPGYLRAYVEGSDDPEAELADREAILPAVTKGEALLCREIDPKSHTTKPPNRFSEAALTTDPGRKGNRPPQHLRFHHRDDPRPQLCVQAKRGPSFPTWVAFAVCRLLETHLPDLVDYTFTAQMERRTRRDQPRRNGPR